MRTAFATAISTVLIGAGCGTSSPAASVVTAAPTTAASAPTSAPPTATPQATVAATPSSVAVLMTGAPSGSRFAPVFVPAELTATAGDVSFDIKNEPAVGQDPAPAHNFILSPNPPELIDGNWEVPTQIAKSGILGPGKSEFVAVSGLAPGTYAFWCQVDGHFTSGMIGTLTLTP